MAENVLEACGRGRLRRLEANNQSDCVVTKNTGGEILRVLVHVIRDGWEVRSEQLEGENKQSDSWSEWINRNSNVTTMLVGNLTSMRNDNFEKPILVIDDIFFVSEDSSYYIFCEKLILKPRF